MIGLPNTSSLNGFAERAVTALERIAGHLAVIAEDITERRAEKHACTEDHS